MGGIFLAFFIVIIVIGLVRLVKGNSPARQLYDQVKELQASRTGIFSGLDPVAVATHAFMNRWRSFEEVKSILKGYRFADEHADIIARKAYDIYMKWLSDKTPAERALYEDRMAKINDALPGNSEERIHPDIKLDIDLLLKKDIIDLQFLMGDIISTPTGQHIVAELALIAAINTPVKADYNAAYYNASFVKLGGLAENPFVRAVLLKGENAAVFPYLRTERSLLMETKAISEYRSERNYSVLANVEGVTEDGRALGFFATDYSVNKNVYKRTPSVNIRITGFAASVSLWSEQNNKLVDQSDVGYSPNDAYGLSYYNFVGKVLKVKGAPLAKNNPGCILTLLLGIEAEESAQLIVDVFVNNDNIKAEQLTKEMKVEGILCFQGEIA